MMKIDSLTARGMFYGAEYYGSFTRALYTLWQVLTGESWSEAVARPLIFGVDQKNSPSSNHVIASIFFVTFLMINSIVLINVVVAVLLEKMVDDPDKDEDESDSESEDKKEVKDSDQSVEDTGLVGGSKRSAKVDIDPSAPVVINGEKVNDATQQNGQARGHTNTRDTREALARMEARLDAIDARFDETQRMLQKVLMALPAADKLDEIEK